MKFYGPIIALTVLMFVAALMTLPFGGRPPFLFAALYASAEVVPFVVACGCFIFLHVARSALVRAGDPLGMAWTDLKPRLRLAILPLVISPVFFGAFTSTKSAIPLITGYHWDVILAAIDHRLFGIDPWRVTHYLFRQRGTVAIEFVYVAVWVPMLAWSAACVPIFASRDQAGRFFAAMFGTWFFGGFVMAYALSSVGPIFAHLVDPRLGTEFAPLRHDLANMLSPDSPMMIGPRWLEHGFKSGRAMPGSGISAMPSMHVAMAALYVLVTRRTWLFWPAIVFLLFIIVGSVHSGYHYFVDTPVALLVAVLCWNLAGRWYNAPSGRSVECEPRFMAGRGFRWPSSRLA